MNGNPAVPGDSWKGRPTWSNAAGYFAKSALFLGDVVVHRLAIRGNTWQANEQESLMRTRLKQFQFVVGLCGAGSGCGQGG